MVTKATRGFNGALDDEVMFCVVVGVCEDMLWLDDWECFEVFLAARAMLVEICFW